MVVQFARRDQFLPRDRRWRRVAAWAAATWSVRHRRTTAFALLVALACAVAFARVTEDYLTNDPLARWDVSFAKWLADHRTAAGLDVFRVVTDVGSPLVSALIAACICVALYRRGSIADAALLPLVVGGAELLNVVLKLSFHRTRPDLGVVRLDTYSYPSGHAMIATAAYGAFGYLLWGATKSRARRAGISVGLATVVLVISFSRLYLGVHYLADVLGALAAGAAWLALCIALRLTYGEAFTAAFVGSRLDRAAARITRSS